MNYKKSNITCYCSDFSNIKLESLRGTFFIPSSLKVVRADQAHLLKGSFRKIKKNEYLNWNRIWQKAIDTKAIFRILLDNGIIKTEREDYFDDILKSNCTVELNETARVIGETLVDLDFKTSDWVLNWRLKKLVKKQQIEAKGVLKDIRDFSVKIIT